MYPKVYNSLPGLVYPDRKAPLNPHLLIGYDDTDPGATERRLSVRGEHLEKISRLKKREKCLFGGAILDESGKMIGSMIVYDFPDRQSL